MGIQPHTDILTARKLPKSVMLELNQSTAVLIHVPTAASSLVVSRCQSGSDCLLFQSQFTSSPQLLAPLAKRGEGKAGFKEGEKAPELSVCLLFPFIASPVS